MLPYDLSLYHLTLPVNDIGLLTGKAQAIHGQQLAAGYQSDWFRQDGTTLIFRCPDGGAVTDTAHYARSELRNETEWSFKEASADLPLKFSVIALGEGQKVVIDQIHDQKEPWVKIVWTHKAKGGELRALVKIKDDAPDTVFQLLAGLKLGDVVMLKCEYQPAGMFGLKAGKLIIIANGHRTKISMHRSGKGGKAYWKRGNYFQSADRKGAVCQVEHY